MRVEVLTAIANTAIALAVGIIALRQWLTARAKFRHELFDRRYAIYERLAGFLADTLTQGRVSPGAEAELLRETKRAYFVFGGDTAVTELITALHHNAVDLHALVVEEKDLNGDELKQNLARQREIKNRFQEALHTMESRFSSYLILKD